MPRAEITRDSVMNAVAEFDNLGRMAFLERYGFNGARDYFLVLDGKTYDSKAIAAVANKWAPGGDGRPLTALELSGGRSDAAKRLRALGFTVTAPAQEAPEATQPFPSGRGNTQTALANFSEAFARFSSLVSANQKGHPFVTFTEGVAAAYEGYKPRLRDRALEILATSTWTETMVGSGEILRCAIDAIEIHEDRLTLTNNLVFWQNRFGHANRDHRAFIEAMDRPLLRRDIERALFSLYRTDENEGGVFERLSALAGAKYPLLAYLFFLKDMDRFLPIQPTGFDQAFRELGIDLVTLRNCTWENYCRFNDAIGDVRDKLAAIDRLGHVRLIDAHSFCWLLVKLPAGEQPAGRGNDPGRVLGARAKAIVNMRLSIEQTVRQSNGQVVSRTLKNKDLLIDPRDLDRLLERLLDIQENRCALTGIPFIFDGSNRNLLPSPDRIDSQGHYAEDNLQVVCQFVNFWKGSADNEEFKQLLEMVRRDDL